MFTKCRLLTSYPQIHLMKTPPNKTSPDPRPLFLWIGAASSNEDAFNTRTVTSDVKLHRSNCNTKMKFANHRVFPVLNPAAMWPAPPIGRLMVDVAGGLAPELAPADHNLVKECTHCACQYDDVRTLSADVRARWLEEGKERIYTRFLR